MTQSKIYQLSADTEITPKLAVRYIRKHRLAAEELEKLYGYYIGDHGILSRPKDKRAANNRLVCNHAKYITDCTTGYFMGSPIQLGSRSGRDISALKAVLRACDSDTQDIDLARLGSIFGVSYEMLYLSDAKMPEIRLASIDPRQAFVVYDDTVEQRPLFGVYYMPIYGDNDLITGYRCYLCDREKTTEFKMNASLAQVGEPNSYFHFFGDVPIIEYYNNGDRQSDFGQVTGLIDAYNLLQSDRVNDKEQFVDAILLIKGQILGDTPDEESETYRAIREFGVMTMDDGGDARWLTRQLDEGSVELLRKSLESDIHKFSGVPCMDDVNFSGNASGVALRYKLLAFEQLTKIKERYFAEGLRLRLKMIANAMFALSGIQIDPSDLEIFFTHSLPENETEMAQTVNLLKDIVPREKLMKLIPFVTAD